MISDNYDIQKLEDALATVFSGVSSNIYKGQRPNSVNTSLPEFVVVFVPTSVVDWAAYGSCVSRIELFVKNIQPSGLKNSALLTTLAKRVRQLFPIIHDDYLFSDTPTHLILGNDGDGYHVHAFQFQTILKNL